jgi:predicted acylesterase/phospholipase RssA
VIGVCFALMFALFQAGGVKLLEERGVKPTMITG